MTTSHPRIVAAALTATALLLAGCGGGNATGKAATTSSVPATAAVAVATSTSGPASTSGAASTDTASTASASTASDSTATDSTATDSTAAVAATTSSVATSPVPALGALPAACRLITESDVHTAMGKDPGSGRPFSSNGSSQCQYGSYQTQFVLVNFNPTRGRAAFDLMANNPKIHNPQLHAGAITGVGDRALGISGPGSASIYFNQGDALIVVSVQIAAGVSPKAQVLTLAKTASSRL